LDGFDPRTTLARRDLADLALEGVLAADRYRATEPCQATAAVAALRKAPDPHAEQTDQLLFGEAFEVLERKGRWAWGRARRDGYVGWVEDAALTPGQVLPSHRVSAIRTYAFPEPDARSSPPMLLTLNSLVTVEAREGRFLKAARAGWIVEGHLAELDRFDADPVAVAERHLGSPYQWGGRESIGLDCSGLVQQALFACGRACPRDADLQEAALGHAIDPSDLRRGDLVFWEGHVAWMLDATRVLHANGFHMQVSIEELSAVKARFGAGLAGEPTSCRRL
jgi:cell wall-associated NlpC family hydrolase